MECVFVFSCKIRGEKLLYSYLLLYNIIKILLFPLENNVKITLKKKRERERRFSTNGKNFNLWNQLIYKYALNFVY